jgi:hypothetical protein
MVSSTDQYISKDDYKLRAYISGTFSKNIVDPNVEKFAIFLRLYHSKKIGSIELIDTEEKETLEASKFATYATDAKITTEGEDDWAISMLTQACIISLGWYKCDLGREEPMVEKIFEYAEKSDTVLVNTGATHAASFLESITNSEKYRNNEIKISTLGSKGFVDNGWIGFNLEKQLASLIKEIDSELLDQILIATEDQFRDLFGRCIKTIKPRIKEDAKLASCSLLYLVYHSSPGADSDEWAPQLRRVAEYLISNPTEPKEIIDIVKAGPRSEQFKGFISSIEEKSTKQKVKST